MNIRETTAYAISKTWPTVPHKIMRHVILHLRSKPSDETRGELVSSLVDLAVTHRAR